VAGSAISWPRNRRAARDAWQRARDARIGQRMPDSGGLGDRWCMGRTYRTRSDRNEPASRGHVRQTHGVDRIWPQGSPPSSNLCLRCTIPTDSAGRLRPGSRKWSRDAHRGRDGPLGDGPWLTPAG
jgi:hypothetical protein